MATTLPGTKTVVLFFTTSRTLAAHLVKQLGVLYGLEATAAPATAFGSTLAIRVLAEQLGDREQEVKFFLNAFELAWRQGLADERVLGARAIL